MAPPPNKRVASSRGEAWESSLELRETLYDMLETLNNLRSALQSNTRRQLDEASAPEARNVEVPAARRFRPARKGTSGLR
jgi:hypothetical protein